MDFFTLGRPGPAGAAGAAGPPGFGQAPDFYDTSGQTWNDNSVQPLIVRNFTALAGTTVVIVRYWVLFDGGAAPGSALFQQQLLIDGGQLFIVAPVSAPIGGENTMCQGFICLAGGPGTHQIELAVNTLVATTTWTIHHAQVVVEYF